MIIVSNIWTTDEAIQAYSARHLISLNDPSSLVKAPPGIDDQSHLDLHFYDVVGATCGVISPSLEHIAEIVSFGKGHIENGYPVLIRCTAGVSRSTAAALVLAASFKTMDLGQLVQLLRDRAPYSRPNSLMISLGDELLSLGGALVTAVQNMGPPDNAGIPKPFVLNVV